MSSLKLSASLGVFIKSTEIAGLLACEVATSSGFTHVKYKRCEGGWEGFGVSPWDWPSTDSKAACAVSNGIVIMFQ